MRVSICILLCVCVLTSRVLAQESENTRYVAQGHLDGSYDIAYITEQTPVINGWYHVLAPGIDAWVAADSSAQWDQMPLGDTAWSCQYDDQGNCKAWIRCEPEDVSCHYVVTIGAISMCDVWIMCAHNQIP